jgi:RimJ/RimL family protein N-acetyltransferase
MPVTFTRRPRMLRGPRLPHPIDARALRTPRAILRPHRMTDAAAWHNLQADPATRQYLDWPERDRSAARRHLRARTRHTRLWQTDDFLALAIEVDGAPAGDVSLHLRSVRSASRIVEIGWVVGKQHTGQGLASEAAAAMLDFAFGEVESIMAIAEIHEGNHASRALAERLGFRPASLDGGLATNVLTRSEHRRRDDHVMPGARRASGLGEMSMGRT